MCGGTRAKAPMLANCMGLSPRVRGNHANAAVRARPGGSIPACAGEPLGTAYLGNRLPVYPRVCGGTLLAREIVGHDDGLSPRVRGTPLVRERLSPRPGLSPRVRGNPVLSV